MSTIILEQSMPIQTSCHRSGGGVNVEKGFPDSILGVWGEGAEYVTGHSGPISVAASPR